MEGRYTNTQEKKKTLFPKYKIGENFMNGPDKKKKKGFQAERRTKKRNIKIR